MIFFYNLSTISLYIIFLLLIYITVNKDLSRMVCDEIETKNDGISLCPCLIIVHGLWFTIWDFMLMSCCKTLTLFGGKVLWQMEHSRLFTKLHSKWLRAFQTCKMQSFQFKYSATASLLLSLPFQPLKRVACQLLCTGSFSASWGALGGNTTANWHSWQESYLMSF